MILSIHMAERETGLVQGALIGLDEVLTAPDKSTAPSRDRPPLVDLAALQEIAAGRGLPLIYVDPDPDASKKRPSPERRETVGIRLDVTGADATLMPAARTGLGIFAVPAGRSWQHETGRMVRLEIIHPATVRYGLTRSGGEPVISTIDPKKDPQKKWIDVKRKHCREWTSPEFPPNRLPNAT
jgi:hypothetical protein